MTDEERRLHQAEAQREEFRQKKGRGWSDPWNIEEMIDAGTTLENIPDWSPTHVSRISAERVKVFTKDDNKTVAIPTLTEIAAMALPSPPDPHPAENAKIFALRRKRRQYKYIAAKVRIMAEPKVKEIQKMDDWDAKQEAVDILFEDLEFALKNREKILGRHPLFGKWVERALEEYLRDSQKPKTSSQDEEAKVNPEPIFMDTFVKDVDSKDSVVPQILQPLRLSTKRETIGRMAEEWELAALKTSRRIMLRDCTRTIAQAVLSDQPSRVVVHGRTGMGKSAALSAIVASARSSGSIVLYISEGDNIHRNFSYCEHNDRRKGLFHLPQLQKEVCHQLLQMHKPDLANLHVTSEAIGTFMTGAQVKRFSEEHPGPEFTLVDLLQYGVDNINAAGACYDIVVDALMKQEEKDFVMVIDEFNCFLQKSMYFHEEYDPEVKKAVPHGQTTLLKPFLDAIGVPASSEEDFVHPENPPSLMKRGSIVVATTESHAVPDAVTDNFVRNASAMAANDPTLCVVEVPRLSKLEFDHMVANYESIGLGNLRMDQGETVMNPQEMEYLRMVTGGEPMKLMNACVI